ncbi:response regulator [bacterium]|nr:MAG: response regulator [bacterium]
MKVLICERDAATARLIREDLERFGHEVVEAHDEREALRRVRTEFTEFVILDGTGIGMAPLRALREAPWTADVPAVVVTTCPEVGVIAEAYRLGADSVLTKPFNPRELHPLDWCD